MSKGSNLDSGASGGDRRAAGEIPASGALAGRRRCSAKRKVPDVLVLLRGVDLEILSRRHGGAAATTPGCHDTILAAAEAGLKSRETGIEDEEKARLEAILVKFARCRRTLEQNPPGCALPKPRKRKAG